MTQDEAIIALREAISRGKALVVCGGGVSVSATGGAAPSWSGLIRKALQSAMRMTAASENDPWVRSVEAYLDSDHVADWLEAALTIEARLGGVTGGPFRDFLHDEIGVLKIVDPGLLDALRALDAPVGTTNYDDCLRLHFGVLPETWLDPQRVTAILRGGDGIWHIHGHWERPQSIVFSRAGYERIRDSELAQFLQREVVFEKSLLFVGCSLDGLSDDNVGELMRWFAASFMEVAGPHFALVRKKDVDAPWPEGVIPVAYGAGYGDLPAFLRAIAPQRKAFKVRDPHMIGRGPQLAEVVRLADEQLCFRRCRFARFAVLSGWR